MRAGPGADGRSLRVPSVHGALCGVTQMINKFGEIYHSDCHPVTVTWCVATQPRDGVQGFFGHDVRRAPERTGSVARWRPMTTFSASWRHRVRVCCLLVLDSVTSTPQWIRQPEPRDVLHDVCVFVCKFVFGSPRASQPLNIR